MKVSSGEIFLYLRLDLEYLCHVLVVCARPHVEIVRYPYELGNHTHPAGGIIRALSLDGALEDVVHAQLPTDLLDALGAPLVLHGTLSRNAPQPVYPGEASRDGVGDTAGEVLVFG